MITLEEVITDWNNMGIALKADLLGTVFQTLKEPSDVSNHNFVMAYLKKRIGSQMNDFLKSVEEIIEVYSLRNLEDGTENKKRNTGRT